METSPKQEEAPPPLTAGEAEAMIRALIGNGERSAAATAPAPAATAPAPANTTTAALTTTTAAAPPPRPALPPLPQRVRVMLSLPGRSFSATFVRSLVTTVGALMGSDRYEVTLSFGYSSMVHFARMKTMGLDVLRGADQKPFGGSSEYDVWVTLDSDVVWAPQQFADLVEATRRHPVVSGAYRMEGGTHFSFVREWDHEHFARHGSFEFASVEDLRSWVTAAREAGDPFVPVAYCGMGFFAARREVLEAMRYPYFDAPLMEMRGEDGRLLRDLCSEDVAFCKNVRAAGFDVVVKVDLVVGHEKMVVL